MSVPNSFLLPEWLLCNFPLSAFYLSESPFVCSRSLNCVHSGIRPQQSDSTAPIILSAKRLPANQPTSQLISISPHHSPEGTAGASPTSFWPYGQTPSHKINRTVSVWPVSGHSARQRTTRSTASDGLANLWPPSQRPNNKINSIRRSGRPLAIHSKPNKMNSIKKFGHAVEIHNTPNNMIESIMCGQSLATHNTINNTTNSSSQYYTQPFYQH